VLRRHRGDQLEALADNGCSRARLPALLAWKLPQVFGFGIGVPVEPEV
jgi:hypothetical protein